MGLYDQVKNANDPYVSQYVGSVVPELNQYAATTQARYSQASDSDDMLSEALGNLKHLNFDGDAQYANELKQQYYQRLQDRSTRGDYENMGRRTRQDAQRFAQAYQPLIQRQQSMGELVKKIQDDKDIADPAVKQALIQKAAYINQPRVDPLTGDYVRDASGKIQLGGIRDLTYAPDVDINKMVLDELSKREADIKLGKEYKDGSGNIITDVKKFRDPKYMADLAQDMINTDPRIKAMINRDTDLQTYKLTPEQVKQQLVDNGYDRIPIVAEGRKGLNKHDSLAAAYSVYADPTKSPLEQQKAQYKAAGYSDEAAERAILNDHIKQKMINDHTAFAGNVLGFEQHTQDTRTDHFAVAKKAAELANIKNPNLMAVQTSASTTSELKPEDLAKNYTIGLEDLKTRAIPLQTSILSALKGTGLATGDSKKDAALAQEYLNNPLKLSALKQQVAQTNPSAAYALESAASDYHNTAALVEHKKNMIEDFEKAGGVDFDKLYQDYKKNPPKPVTDTYLGGTSLGASSSQYQPNNIPANLSKEDFINAIRAGKYSSSDYINSLQEGKKKVLSGDAQGSQYTTLEPTGNGKLNDFTSTLTDLFANNKIKGIDLNGTSTIPTDIAETMGIKPNMSAKDKAEAMKNMSVRFNTESVNGKPTIQVKGPDGTTRTFQTNNLPEGVQNEINLEVIRQGAASPTTSYGKRLIDQGLIGYGSTKATDITPQYLKSINGDASGVLKPLNNDYSVKIKNLGNGEKEYELYGKVNGKLISTGHKVQSVDDLFRDLGRTYLPSELNQTELQTLNLQR